MRLLSVSHAICPSATTGGGEPTYQSAVQLHDYRYDFAGRIVSDGRSGNDGLLSRYTYNIRSAHDSIMVGKNLQGVFGTTFHEVLRYNTSRSGMQDTPQWSGNIASIDWKAGNTDVMHSYGFVYDALSRLTGASYSAAGVSTGLYDRAYSYDLNGNILSITTPSGTTTMNYTGNQLTGVSDAIPFDYPVVEGDFVYDSNGNMTWDASRDFSHGEYNILNLPQSFSTRIGGIAIASNNMLYSADGEKLQSSSTLGTAVTDYTGNLVFKNDSLRTVFFDGGFIAVDYTGGVASYNYRFFVNDHLGNIRVVTDSYGTLLQVNHYDPYGNLLPIVTPSSSTPIVNLSDTGSILAGSSLSDRLFGGKEWQTKAFSYDFGARHFAPGVPRWTSLDPFSEKYYSISPYVYCAGNPMNFVDHLGLDVWEIDKNGIVRSHYSDDTQDAFYIVDMNSRGKYERLKDSSGKELGLIFNYGTVENSTTKPKGKNAMFELISNQDGGVLFKFLADNTDVEHGFIGTSDNYSVVFTNNEIGSVKMYIVAKRIIKEGKEVSIMMHNHPHNSLPSGFDKEMKDGDKAVVNAMKLLTPNHISYYVYRPAFPNAVRKYDENNYEEKKWFIYSHSILN